MTDAGSWSGQGRVDCPEGDWTRNRSWRHVVRTGRTSAEAWERTFGPPAAPVLDVGAGDSPWAAQLLAVGCHAVALDPQYSMRGPAGRVWESACRGGHAAAADRHDEGRGSAGDGFASLSHAQTLSAHGCVIAGVAERLPFQDECFRTVYLGYCLQHVQDPVAALRECLRVASIDGRVVLHPVWAHGSRRDRACERPGVTLVLGKRRPRRRPSLSLDPAATHTEAALRDIARALLPAAPIRVVGALAMRSAIRILGTTSVSPRTVR